VNNFAKLRVVVDVEMNFHFAKVRRLLYLCNKKFKDLKIQKFNWAYAIRPYKKS